MSTSSTTEGHDYLARVRKLLAVAEDPATPREAAESYMAKAAQLIADHGIDAAMANATAPTRETVEVREVWIPAPYAMDKSTLLHNIATRMQCKTVRMVGRAHKPGERGSWVLTTLIGYPADADRVELLLNSLTVQAVRFMLDGQTPTSWDWMSASQKAAYRRSWYAGFTNEVSSRVAAAERRARRDYTERTGTSTDLVIVDRSTAVEQQFQMLFPHTNKARRRLSGSGQQAGRAAGARADLGGTRVGSGSGRALPA